MSRITRSLLNPALASLLLALLATTPLHVKVANSQEDKQLNGATTLDSKQKIRVLIDREQTENETVLLLKIIVPEDSQVEALTIPNPSRIVIDFKGVKIKSSENLVPPKNEVLKMIRLGAHADKLRVVLDLATPDVPKYEWRATSRQAVLRIIESSKSSAKNATAPATPPATPTKAPAATFTHTPAASPTPIPATPTTKTIPTSPPTAAPTLTPTRAPTYTNTAAPTATQTPAPTIPVSPTPIASTPEQPAALRQNLAKLPDMSEKELEEALDIEVAKASQALERGEKLPDTIEADGEDLVDVPEDANDEDPLGDNEPGADASDGDQSFKDTPEVKNNKNASIVAKDLQVTITGAVTRTPDQITGLRSNPTPVAPTVEFSVKSAEFAHLEPEHKESFRLTLSRPGAQAQMSKVDPTTYKIVIQRCDLANLGLALPQYPPSDFKGILAISPKVEGDTVEITAQVEQGVALTTLVRDREIWITKQ